MEKAKKEDFVECEACSAKQGRQVLVHKSHLRIEEEMLDDDHVICPRGHVLPNVKPEEVVA